jgi:hypothetical protein
MGRLDQTDTSAPCNHLGSLLVCSALTTTEKNFRKSRLIIRHSSHRMDHDSISSGCT